MTDTTELALYILKEIYRLETLFLSLVSGIISNEVPDMSFLDTALYSGLELNVNIAMKKKIKNDRMKTSILCFMIVTYLRTAQRATQ